MVVNDADFQGVGLVSGSGLEMVVTLGTGFGTALLQDGKLLPHLELSHLPVTKSKNYDQYIGQAAMDEIGPKRAFPSAPMDALSVNRPSSIVGVDFLPSS